MWNRFGRVVTLGVGAGVHFDLNCHSCTHVCISIRFSQFQMILNSCMWDHDLPVGIAPTEDEQALPTRHFCPSGGCSLFSFLLSYSAYTILLTMVCELTGWRYPNLLPVAGGGGADPHAMCYFNVYFFLHPESSSEGIRHLWFNVSYHVSYQVSYLSRTVTHHLSWGQLPVFSYHFV